MCITLRSLLWTPLCWIMAKHSVHQVQRKCEYVHVCTEVMIPVRGHSSHMSIHDDPSDNSFSFTPFSLDMSPSTQSSSGASHRGCGFLDLDVCDEKYKYAGLQQFWSIWHIKTDQKHMNSQECDGWVLFTDVDEEAFSPTTSLILLTTKSNTAGTPTTKFSTSFSPEWYHQRTTLRNVLSSKCCSNPSNIWGWDSN